MNHVSQMSRRAWLRAARDASCAICLTTAAGSCVPSRGTISRTDSTAATSSFSPEEIALLDDIERTGCLYFWEASHPKTGLAKDRSLAQGADIRRIASIAATGFGLTALCIAAERGFLSREAVRERVRTTLRFLQSELPHEHGFYFHFIDWETGQREWSCELSSIDTALLLCGVIMVGEYFRADGEIAKLAREIYERVDWQWMLAGGLTLSHGWKPENGFLKNRWDHYCELMLLYLLALGSPTHPIPASCWNAWTRPRYRHFGHDYIGSPAPLFVHQYSHAWFDFQNRRDASADYFENSITATKVHRLFCIELHKRFPQFGEDLWGLTASDSAEGYQAWGGPPEMGKLDGTLVPCAAAGSLPFLPRETLHTLRVMRERFGDRVWKRYGFVDAFNPHTGWFNPDVIGIDVGISVLMAENAQSGLVWRTFMRNEGVRCAMQRAGFRISA